MLKLYDEIENPLDAAEDIFKAHDWHFDRIDQDKINIFMSGKSGEYEISFIWQEQYNSIVFSCEFTDMCIRDHRIEHAIATIYNINNKLWLGHFGLSHDNNAPVFRHTSLFRGLNGSFSEHIEDLIDIALNECEKYHPVFSLLTTKDAPDPNQLAFALIDSGGES